MSADGSVLEFEPFQIYRAAVQSDVELIFPIQREIVSDRESTACSERQSLDMYELRQVGGRAVDLTQRRSAWIAHRQGAHLVRRGEVLLQKGRLPR